MHAAGLYGCRFDPEGSNTECGVIDIVDLWNDDVTVLPLPKEVDATSLSGTR